MSATVTGQATADEYRAMTAGCALIDRSERGKLLLCGADAVEFLNGQVTNELLGLRDGDGCYAAFLTHKGKMLGDLRVLAVGEDRAGPPCELLLDTERVALQALFDLINRFKIGYEVGLSKRTLQQGLLSLLGPETDAVLMRAADRESAGSAGSAAGGGLDAWSELPPSTEHAHRRASLAGHPVRLVRTAHPAGVDVFCEATDRERVEAALARAGARPVSESAGEVVRVEHGRPRYGVDLDDTVIPQEAGLNGRAVSFTKGCYVGQETVARLHYKGKPNRHLRGLRLSEALPGGQELHLGDRAVGCARSAVLSPVHGALALALVRREVEPGAVVQVGDGGATAVVSGLPFASAPDRSDGFAGAAVDSRP